MVLVSSWCVTIDCQLWFKITLIYYLSVLWIGAWHSWSLGWESHKAEIKMSTTRWHSHLKPEVFHIHSSCLENATLSSWSIQAVNHRDLSSYSQGCLTTVAFSELSKPRVSPFRWSNSGRTRSFFSRALLIKSECLFLLTQSQLTKGLNYMCKVPSHCHIFLIRWKSQLNSKDTRIQQSQGLLGILHATGT